MSDFDVSMRLHRPEGGLPPEERKPLDWSKFTTVIQICGAILTIPVGIAGVYAAYRSNFSAEVTCQALRTTIIATLEKNVDMDTKRALARRDVAEFERTCAAIDPDAKRVFASMMAPKSEPSAASAVAAPEPVAKDTTKPVIKANAAPHDPISEAIEREAARAAALPARAPGVVAPASVATPLTTPHVKPAAAKPADVKPAEKPAMVERAATERTAVAPKGDKPTLGEPPAPLGSRLPAEATNSQLGANPSSGPKPIPAVTPAATPRTAALPETSPVTAPDTTSTPMGGPIPPAAPPPLETANVPGLNTPAAAPYTPPPVARQEPAKKSGMIPFVSDLFGGAPPRPPGEIARDAVPENGPAN